MACKNNLLKLITMVVILVLALVSCKDHKLSLDAKDNISKGVIKGNISIGPLCPVETYPPNPLCQPTLETYKAWATAVWSKDKRTKIADTNPNLDGFYQLILPTGDYILDFDSNITKGTGRANLPYAITIVAGDTSKFDIAIDTGIR